MADGAEIGAGWRGGRRARALGALAAAAVAVLALWRLRPRRAGRLADLTEPQLRDVGVGPHDLGPTRWREAAERDMHRLLRGGR